VDAGTVFVEDAFFALPAAGCLACFPFGGIVTALGCQARLEKVGKMKRRRVGKVLEYTK
jgi:hypothetical protein